MESEQVYLNIFHLNITKCALFVFQYLMNVFLSPVPAVLLTIEFQTVSAWAL